MPAQRLVEHHHAGAHPQVQLHGLAALQRGLGLAMLAVMTPRNSSTFGAGWPGAASRARVPRM